jgi:hypothetical protein
MKKNENISISLQIQRDKESKLLFLSVHFNKEAPNLSIENESITWYPTRDEIDFIADAFHLIGESKEKRNTIGESNIPESSTEVNTVEPTLHSSEIRIPPLPDDPVIDINADSERAHSNKDDTDEKIFIQADEKKIDEVLKRKRPGMDEEYVIESGEKTIIDRMLKQKRKKSE